MSCADINKLASATEKGEKVKDFEYGSLYKVYENGKVRDVIVFKDSKSEDFSADKHATYFKRNKISKELEKLIQKDPNKKYPVAIWFKDIDFTEIETQAKESLKIYDLKKADNKDSQKVIEEKRKLARERYINHNKNYKDKYLKDAEILFISRYAPFIIVNMKPGKIKNLAKNEDIAYFQLVNDSPKVDETKYSIPNINAAYLRDNLGLSGAGIKIGIVEMYYADKSNEELSDRKIIFDVSDEAASADTGIHATKVAGIIVGKKQGIVPDAIVYMAAAKNRIEDYEKIEWLIDQGVNVINYSAGYTADAGLYSDMAKWIDHISFQHNITFVKSAGNGGEGSYITDPGMAYNALTVGSICENDSANEPYWEDDSFSAYSSYLESEGGYKPDLTAPGEGIDVAGLGSGNGTSFSAAHVTGVIAQILQAKPDLKSKPAALNALLKAGTTHKTADDYNDYTLISDYSNKEGAGVIDAKGALITARSDNYVQLKLRGNSFPYIQTINVDSASGTVRVVLNWLKQNTLLSDGSLDLRNISDLDLYVVDPNGNTVGISTTANNNTELVEFNPTVTGAYTIVVDGYMLENDYEIIGLAWYQQ